MPVFNIAKGPIPEWCELNLIDIHVIPEGDSLDFSLENEKEILFCGSGQFEVGLVSGQKRVAIDARVMLGVKDVEYQVRSLENSTVIRIGGNWPDESGSSGVFHLYESRNPQNKGDDHPYRRNTVMDYHYHDCNEYWIFYSGSGGIITDDGRVYDIAAGDCVVTRAGIHHDMHWVNRELHGVYLETSLKGKKRPGHLWNHTHGVPDKKDYV